MLGWRAEGALDARLNPCAGMTENVPTDGDPPMEVSTGQIVFSGQRRARIVFARRDTRLADIVRALDVPVPRGVLVLNGGTAGFSPEEEALVAPLLAEGVAKVVIEEGVHTPSPHLSSPCSSSTPWLSKAASSKLVSVTIFGPPRLC
jgi:hypothetical protein